MAGSISSSEGKRLPLLPTRSACALGGSLHSPSTLPLSDTASRQVVSWALPGGIDARRHLDQPIGDESMADGFTGGTRSSACGGTTRLMPFPAQMKGQSSRAGGKNLDGLTQARNVLALVTMHAENADRIGWLSDGLERTGDVAPKFHAAGRTVSSMLRRATASFFDPCQSIPAPQGQEA